MADDDLRYFQRRAEAELEIAQRSEQPQATAIHYELAEAYLARVQVLAAAGAVALDANPGEVAETSEGS